MKRCINIDKVEGQKISLSLALAGGALRKSSYVRSEIAGYQSMEGFSYKNEFSQDH